MASRLNLLSHWVTHRTIVVFGFNFITASPDTKH